MTFIINQLIFLLINTLMAGRDANKIKAGKLPDHFQNGLAYILSIIIFSMIFKMGWFDLVTFIVACFCNRQLFFDIPLNLLRKLKWDYVSLTPTSIVDKIEKKIFGLDGRKPVYIYAGTLVLTILINLIF